MATSHPGSNETDTGDLLRDVWDTSADPELDADCSPTKVCRNARDFTFDGIADGDEDLSTSWRRLLQEEGKFSTAEPSVRELIFGSPTE